MLVALTAVLLHASPALSVPFERYHLANGLVVILHEDHRVPKVTVNLWYRVGSKDEAKGRSGFAHLFEHLMFMGTRNLPNGQFDSLMETQGGANNASTGEDATNYYESGPPHLLETFLWMEGDRLGSLADDMTLEKLNLQREVVKNERRQGSENQPYGEVELRLPELMFPEGHPYHHSVIGSHQDLSAAKVEDVKAFFRQWYVPSNASLVVAGDFEPAQARAWVEKYLGWLPLSPVPAHNEPAPVRLKKSVREVLKDAVENERVVMAWHAPAAWAPLDAETELLASVLGDGSSSRLTQALVYEQKLAQDVEVGVQSLRYAGIFTITATAQKGHTAVEMEKAIEAQLGVLEKKPPTDEEVERARALRQTRTLTGLEQTFEVAEGLNEMEFYFGDPGQLSRSALTRFDNIQASSVGAAARLMFATPHVTLSVVPGKKKGVQR